MKYAILTIRKGDGWISLADDSLFDSKEKAEKCLKEVKRDDGDIWESLIVPVDTKTSSASTCPDCSEDDDDGFTPCEH